MSRNWEDSIRDIEDGADELRKFIEQLLEDKETAEQKVKNRDKEIASLNLSYDDMLASAELVYKGDQATIAKLQAEIDHMNDHISCGNLVFV